MRVVLDTTPLLVRHAGIATYALELIRSMLRQTGPDEELVAFDPLAGFKPSIMSGPPISNAETRVAPPREESRPRRRSRG